MWCKSTSIHSAELQSAEIRSLTLKSSAKGILPEFECRAQNRVHVETALIHYASRPLRYRRAAFKENFMVEENKCCENCAYHDDWTHVCFNPESKNRADFTDNEDSCTEWESKEDNSCKKKI